MYPMKHFEWMKQICSISLGYSLAALLGYKSFFFSYLHQIHYMKKRHKQKKNKKQWQMQSIKNTIYDFQILFTLQALHRLSKNGPESSLSGSSFMCGGRTLHKVILGMLSSNFFRIFLGAVHYGSPSGGGGWHSLYNLVGETDAPLSTISTKQRPPPPQSQLFSSCTVNWH